MFLVEYGFGDPTLIDNSIVIYKKNLPETTLSIIQEIVGSIKQIYTPKSLYVLELSAETLSKMC